MVKKVCVKCEKEIDLNSEKHVLLGTYDGKKTLEEAYFHFDCWRKYFDQKAKAKAKTNVDHMKTKAKGIFENLKDNPMLSGLLGGSQGSQIQDMLNKEIEVEGLPDMDDLLGKKKEEKKEDDKD